jgi:hypothetical protein
MDDQQEGCSMPDFDDLEARLREHRYRASGLELDQIKQRAIARASRSRTTGVSVLRTRFITLLAVIGLMAAGTGGVIAASGGSGSPGSAAVSQYFTKRDCDELIRDDRAFEKREKNQHRSQEHRARGRFRARLVRQNRAIEAGTRRADRRQEARCRDKAR